MDTARRKRTGFLVLTLSLVAIGAFLDTAPAVAFDCAQGPAVAPLEKMDAALVGIPVEHLGRLGSSFDIMRFEVVEPIKGTMADEVVLLVNAAGAYEYDDTALTPGGERFGEEAGVQLYDLSAPVVASACTSTDPSYVREAAHGLPRPNSDVVVQAVSIGQDLDTTHRMIGELGHIAAYVGGDDDLYHARFCTDGLTLAETYRSVEGPFLRWRDMRTLEVIAEVEVPSSDNYSTAVVESCVDGNRVLLRASNGYVVMDPDGSVGLSANDAFSGSVADIALSANGSTVAAITNQHSLQVAFVDEPERVARQLDDVGKVISNVAVSPDGNQIAFLRGSDKMRMVIVDKDGIEQSIIVDPGYAGAEIINWVDEQTIATGGSTITYTTLSEGDPSVVAYGLETLVDLELGYVDPPTHRTAVYTDEGPAVLDLRTGETISIRGIRPRGIVVATPETITLEAKGFEPAGLLLPLPGGRVPATLDELIDILRQNPDRFPDLAALERFDLAGAAAEVPRVEPAEDVADTGAAVEADDSSTAWWPWVFGFGGLGAVIVGLVAVRRGPRAS